MSLYDDPAFIEAKRAQREDVRPISVTDSRDQIHRENELIDIRVESLRAAQTMTVNINELKELQVRISAYLDDKNHENKE